ncbi:MAG: hypothetical protein P8J44_04930 [Gammaproteobacteria bacterium]|nr:hypothetical protein [Gammaproteobacteria bacterium]
MNIAKNIVSLLPCVCTLLLYCLGSNLALAQPSNDERPLLDVSIEIFAMNLPQDALTQQAEDVYPAVRQAEARYLPSFLKLILEESVTWGAVRLLPEPDSGAELQISASIVSSNGTQLELALIARDATGRIWAEKTYTGTAVESVSLNQPLLGTDPFLYLYQSIAYDLAEMASSLSNAQLNEIKSVALLQYAALLAPAVFTPYLSSDENNMISLARLPADNDPFLLRVKQIREHEYVFIDVVDEQYESFFVTIKPVYDLWRRYRREQIASEIDKINREMRQSNDLRRGSYMSLLESYNNFRWARMQDQYLDEISEGFTNEVLPTDITLEDSLYHLSGTLEEQYQEWKSILKELYELDEQSP